MNININIEEIVSNAVQNVLTQEKLQPIITKNVESEVKSAIDNAFGYGSEFRKMLESKIREAMPADIDGMGRFGDLVLKTIQAYVNETQAEFVRNAVNPKLESMLRKLPEKMKLSEIAEMLTKDFAENLDCENRHSEQPTFIVERSTKNLDGYWRFYADPDERKSKYTCRLQMAFNSEGKCYSLNIGGEEIPTKLLIGPAYNADALVLNLYTNHITVELDKDDFSDMYYEGEDY